MLQMKDIILISDIHNTYTGIERAVKYARLENKKILFLGDIFDRGNNLEKTIEIINNNLDIITIIIGNHDDMLYHTFNIYNDNDKIQTNLTHCVQNFLNNDKHGFTLKSLTSKSCPFEKDLLYNNEFMNTIKAENNELFKKIENIKNESIIYTEIKDNDYTFRFSHSGNIEIENDTHIYNTETLWALSPTENIIKYRKNNNIIDVCGHWSHSSLFLYLQKFKINYLVRFLDDSEYVYVPSWNCVYIDNGTGNNVIKDCDLLAKQISDIQKKED